MRLRIHGDKAHARMLAVQYPQFQDGLLHYWVVRPNGTVAAHSLLWLFCWADTGHRDAIVMEDCRRFWDEFTGVPFSGLDSSDFGAFARDGRYKTRLSDATLLAEMQRLAGRDLPFLADASSTTFPALPPMPVGKAAAPVPPTPLVSPHTTPAPTRARTAPAPPPPQAPLTSLAPVASRPSASDLDRLHAICRATDDRIWQTYQASTAKGTCGGASTMPAFGLVFPSYTSRPGLRVSEQETRVLFCQQVEAAGTFSYSVETPTEGRYAWSATSADATSAPMGTAGMSARLDVTLYRPDQSRAVNVEFKAGGNGASLGMAASQDLVKLMVEPCDGLWFGVLESTTDRFLRAILDALWTTVTRVVTDGSVAASLPMNLVFHLTVLAPAFSIHRAITVTPAASGRRLTAPEFATVRFPAGAPAGGAREIADPGAWTRRFAPPS